MLSSICSRRRCDARLAEQLKAPAQHHELTADLTDGLTVVLAEIGYRLEIWHQAASQPDELDVALALPLKAPARLDAIEVSVDVDLQQRRRMVGRPSRRQRLDTAEAELSQVKLINEDIDRPDRIVIAQIVIQSLREQSALAAIITHHKARHQSPRQITEESYHPRRFHTAWVNFGRWRLHAASASHARQEDSIFRFQIRLAGC